MRTRRPPPYLLPSARKPLGRAFAFAAAALGLGLSAGAARAEAPKKETYALGWARLPGAEPCIGSRDLAAGVEKSLKRRVFVSAARADRNVEGHVGPRFGGGWVATVQIADGRGHILGSRELASTGPNCRELDEAITLSVALMIDSNLSAPPADPLETGPAAPALAPSPADVTTTSLPDKDDPWGGAPPPKPREQPTIKGRGPGEEGFELAALAGYSIGGETIPVEETTTSGLNAGVGLRAGYQFASGLWLGFGFIRYSGGNFVQTVDPVQNIYFQKGNYDPNASQGYILGNFRAYVPSLEAGYGFSLGPLEGRPYLGFGFVVYDFTVSSAYGASDYTSGYYDMPEAQRWDVDTSLISFAHNALKVSIWPGFSLAWPVGPFFFGADTRMMFIVGGRPSFIPSLTAGVRF